MIEFHSAALLINNAIEVTGLYHALWSGDDVCASAGARQAGGQALAL